VVGVNPAPETLSLHAGLPRPIRDALVSWNHSTEYELPSWQSYASGGGKGHFEKTYNLGALLALQSPPPHQCRPIFLLVKSRRHPDLCLTSRGQRTFSRLWPTLVEMEVTLSCHNHLVADWVLAG
jgi:hypothetical protein